MHPDHARASDALPPGSPPSPVDQTAALLDLVLRTDAVEEQLQQVADAAAALHADVAACGITVRRGRRALSVGSSHSLSQVADELQYDEEEGPCLQSLTHGVVVVVDDYARESRWGAYPGRVAEHGLRSSLSLPLAPAGRPIGALNTYGTAPGMFTGALRDDLTAFAARAEKVVALALRHAEQAEMVGHLHAAMESRSVIDQALGVLMAQERCTADEAFAVLRRASQGRNRKVADLAADIVASVSGGPPRPGRFVP
ncbi:GAF and ANTAR domain-containing protein [Cellulomonas sp.]|uniref:GAF and ANTAR domain-containing protein n=1 Tax=Cellulomonas sp. TaxID=40001 RepID=UPI002811C108|nr:GAF and ANTAR domain-containing protein [Cellulomonas sp.]